jgi:hypothetical protein
MRPDEQLVQVDRVDEQVEEHRAARFQLAAFELGQVAQHDVARRVLTLDRGDLLGDQVAVALVEVVIEVVKIGPREQIVRAGKHALGERLLFDAVHLPAAHQGRPVCVPEPACKYPCRIDERLDGREVLFKRHDHHEERREADLRPAVAVHHDQRQHEGQRHDSAPERHRIDGGDAGSERRQEPDHAARQHFVVLVLEGARHVDHARAERAGRDSEAQILLMEQEQANDGR